MYAQRPSVESIRANQIKKMASNPIISKRLPPAADRTRHRDTETHTLGLAWGTPYRRVRK